MEAANNQVLVIDDESDIRELLQMTLLRMGLITDCAATTAEALSLLSSKEYQLCLTDMRLPDGDGLAVLEHVAQHCPSTPVAVITAHGSAENAVAALKAGAFDYLAKPVSLQQLRTLVRSALKLPRHAHARKAEGDAASALQCPALIGDSAIMQATRDMIAKLARCPTRR